jgi:flavin-dependent dehydrogenase
LKPVQIAGGGISGFSAALNLAKNGIDSVVFEKQSTIGGARNGDYEGLENWIFPTRFKLFQEIGLDSFSLDSFPVTEFLVHCPPNDPINISSREPFFSIVSRGAHSKSIDQWLYRSCINNGVEIKLGETCNFEKADIIATGSRKAAAYIQGGSFKSDLSDQVHLLLGDNFAPKGYAYIIIKRGKGTLATAYKKPKSGAKNYIEDTTAYFQRAGISISLDDMFASRGSFQLPVRNPFSKQIYIGEAGGYQDCLFGFGMKVGMMSGWMAASYLAGNNQYAFELNKMLREKLRFSYINRVIYERLNDSMKYALTLTLAKSDNPIQHLRSSYEWNWKRLLTFTSRRKPVEIHFT